MSEDAMTAVRYEVDLNLNEQRMALMGAVDATGQLITAVRRKRSMRESEKAMSIASYKRRRVALLMAVERIDAELREQNARPSKEQAEAIRNAGIFPNDID
jgi:hypothetical protein